MESTTSSSPRVTTLQSDHTDPVQKPPPRALPNQGTDRASPDSQASTEGVFQNGMTPAENDKYISGLYKLAKPRTKLLCNIRKKHFLTVNKVSSTMNKARKDSGQAANALSFKPVGLFAVPPAGQSDDDSGGVLR